MKNIIFLVLIGFGFLKGQSVNEFTGVLAFDSKNIGITSYKDDGQITPLSPKKKSPMLHGLFSLLLPGSGQLLTDSYIEAGIFIALEVAAVSYAIVNDSKGDDKTKEFQQVADNRWSVVKYAEWLNRYKNAAVPIDPNSSLKPWERVNWDSLNAYESSFSHRLPKYGEQQYYELIGKYHQYSPGWDEFNPNNNNNADIPPIFLSYAVMRGEANDFYNVATKAVLAIYINHFLSGVHAIWSAAMYNSNLNLTMSIDENEFKYHNSFSPKVNLRVGF